MATSSGCSHSSGPSQNRTPFAGKYKYLKNENYEEYLKFMNVGWLKRKLDILLGPKIVICDGPACDTLVFKRDYCEERTVVLGEEHVETLPGGEEATGVTVQEGDDCLITRLKDPWHLEVRREFSPEGMTQFVRHLDSDLEAVRYFKRCL